jgi:response regulator NasT
MNERTSMKALAQAILATEGADDAAPAGGPTG